jgi:hypothetical protein
MDIIATRRISGTASFSFAIECKTSRDKPWVAFASNKPSFRDELCFFAPLQLSALAISLAVDELWLGQEYDCAAVSIVQAFRDGSRGIDNAYSAVQGASRAAIGLNRHN